MAGILKKIQDNADKARAKIAAKGLREHAVTLNSITWVGRDPTLGNAGDKAVTSTPLLPAPSIENVSVGLINHSAGVIQMGDVLVSKISRSSAYAALIQDPSVVWAIEGPYLAGEYSLVGGTLKMERTEWRAVLRRLVQ